MQRLEEVPIQERFRIWYKEPLAHLRRMDHGHGGIAALVLIMPLYERAYRFAVHKGAPDNRPLWVKNDLSLKSENEAKIFWNKFRDGLCHTGSFFEQSDKYTTLPDIGLDASYPDMPTFTKVENDVIILNVWGFVDHVLTKYEGNQEILEYVPAPLLLLHRSV